jgi:hypothetical protein
MTAVALTRREHWRATTAIVAARIHVARAMDTLALDPSTPASDQPVLLHATHRRLSEIRSALITALALLEAYGTTHLATPRGHRPHSQETTDFITNGAYDAVDNPHQLQIAVHELHRVQTAVGQLADAFAETTATEDHRAAGLHAAKNLIESLLTQAHRRHQQITSIGDSVDVHLAHLVSAVPNQENEYVSREPVMA